MEETGIPTIEACVAKEPGAANRSPELRAITSKLPDVSGARVSTTECHDARSNEIAAEIRRRLCSTGHLVLRTVECEYQDGTAVLRGRVPTYYVKQIAQSSLLSSPLVKTVVNLIEVSGTGRGRESPG
jgi:hypothetical protein